MPRLFRRKTKDDDDTVEQNSRRGLQEEGRYRRRELEAERRIQEIEQVVRREREEAEKLEQNRKEQEELEFYRQQQIDEQRQEDETRRLNQLRKATPETLRKVRELIRARYELDVYIWNCRSVQKADQEIIIREGMEADTILQEIHDIVDSWEVEDWDPKELEVAKKIKENLKNGEQRTWADNHPWNDPDA